jgi:hypothetical protein
MSKRGTATIQTVDVTRLLELLERSAAETGSGELAAVREAAQHRFGASAGQTIRNGDNFNKLVLHAIEPHAGSLTDLGRFVLTNASEAVRADSVAGDAPPVEDE